MKSNLRAFMALAFSSAIAATQLSGCGGGGGGGGGGGSVATTTSAGDVLSGVAAKGPLLNAKVTAYCGKKIDNDSLGSDTTRDGSGGTTVGAYSITLSKSCSKPVQLVVEATAATKILDEINGSITAPAAFQMRAFIPAIFKNTTKNITPLTDMAAQLVESSKADLSVEMVANAETAIVTTVLGGSVAVYNAQPKLVKDYPTATPDEKNLMQVLTAISAAATSATGATAGDKLQEVLKTLAAQAAATVTSVTASAYTVASNASATTSPLKTINDGFNALQNGTVASVDPDIAARTMVNTTIKADINTAKTAVTAPAATATTKAASSGTTPVTAATGIAAAKALFTALRSNVLSLANSSDTGFLQTRGKAINDDFATIQGTGNDLNNVMSSFSRAAEFANDVAVGNATKLGSLIVNAASGNYYFRSWSNNGSNVSTCAYYTTDGTVSQQSGKAVCRYLVGSYVYTSTGYSYTDNYLVVWRTSAGNYSYDNRTVSTVCPTGGTCTATPNPKQSGTFTAAHDATGNLTSFVLSNGKYAPLVTGAADATLNLTADKTSSGGTDKVNVTGSAASGPVLISFLPGSTFSDTPSTGARAAKIVGQIKTSAFQFDGTFNASVASNNTGQAGFLGAISTLSGGTATEFLNGSVTATLTAQADRSKPISATNFDKGSLAFSGVVTNSGNVSQISGTVDNTVYGQQAVSFSYIIGGSYSLTASGTRYDSSANPNVMTIISCDNIKIVLTQSAAGTNGTVMDPGNTQIGTITAGTNQVNFSDGTFIVLL